MPMRYDQLEVNGRDSSIATDVLIEIDPSEILEVYQFQRLEGDDASWVGWAAAKP